MGTEEELLEKADNDALISGAGSNAAPPLKGSAVFLSEGIYPKLLLNRNMLAVSLQGRTADE